MPRALASVLEVISDEAMDRAVQVGLARSEDDTWRMVERCLAPARALARAREDLRAEPPTRTPSTGPRSSSSVPTEVGAPV
jgi:hypothetical protein